MMLVEGRLVGRVSMPNLELEDLVLALHAQETRLRVKDVKSWLDRCGRRRG